MTDLLAAAQRRPRDGGGRIAAIAALSAFLSTGAGFLIGSAYLMPLLNALSIYPFYLELVLAGRRRRAVVLVLLWAIFLSEAMIIGTYFLPGRAERVTLVGASYRDEMFHWVATGEGEESSPGRFIPSHAKHFAVFVVLSFVTAGLGGLVMGAVLLNYMNFYVGSLVLMSRSPILSLLFGWQPYAILRVVAYVVVATALAEAFFSTVKGRKIPRRATVYAAAGLAGVILDVLVKFMIAPSWARLLRWIVGS
ncbi:MAG: hypothetical protein ACYTAN_03000 [Planctomycetota bacterium]|jgi:hypothetical protein